MLRGKMSEGIKQLDINEYEFNALGAQTTNYSGTTTKFELTELRVGEAKQRDEQQVRDQLLKGATGDFTVSPIVKLHLGAVDQEEQEYQERVKYEVACRVAKIEEEAFNRGHQQGIASGREEIFAQTKAVAEEKIGFLSMMISEVIRKEEELIANQKQQIYQLVRNLTKWVILRELSDDGEYLHRLLEKVLLELQAKRDVLIKVKHSDFDKMPEVLEALQSKLGDISNVRVELDYGLEGPGIIVESENGIINASLPKQFNALDKLFESVGLQGGDNSNLVAEVDQNTPEQQQQSESSEGEVENIQEDQGIATESEQQEKEEKTPGGSGEDEQE
ncbi:MAG: hypothetical protein HN353_04655 [Bdellovibrionales bacterium]|nr:hypothetical protein [Bdellovibrionales bacterium]MBT3527424.1 hypothetical protein [Bdellovibrionales bacterium]MBT7669121.1 hypothetical protein [Bdellovibrionales bacterium]MBT7766929.1 hypothetical protein [Bdellovibrionales bacterium]